MHSYKLRVTTRALTQRINRVLPSGKRLVFDRRKKEFAVVNLGEDLYVMRVADLKQLATDLGVLKPYEELLQ